MNFLHLILHQFINSYIFITFEIVKIDFSKIKFDYRTNLVLIFIVLCIFILFSLYYVFFYVSLPKF